MRWYNKMMAALGIGAAMTGAYIWGVSSIERGPKCIPYQEFREDRIEDYIFRGHVIQDVKKRDINADGKTDFLVLHQRPPYMRTLEEPSLTILRSSQGGYVKSDLRIGRSGFDNIDDSLIMTGPDETNGVVIILYDRDNQDAGDYIYQWNGEGYQEVMKKLDEYLKDGILSGRISPLYLASELRKQHSSLLIDTIASSLSEMSDPQVEKYLTNMLVGSDLPTAAYISSAFSERVPPQAAAYLTKLLYRGPPCPERNRIALQLGRRGERRATNYLIHMFRMEEKRCPTITTDTKDDVIDILSKLGGWDNLWVIAKAFGQYPNSYDGELLSAARTHQEKEWLARFFNEAVFDNTYFMSNDALTYFAMDEDAKRLRSARVHCSIDGLRVLEKDSQLARHFLSKMPRIFEGVGPEGAVYLDIKQFYQSK